MATPDEIPSDLTLEIGEELPPEQFIAAARHFFGYVEEVARDFSDQGVRIGWRVIVREGSTLIALSPDKTAPAEVLRAVYSRVSGGVDAVTEGHIEDSQVSEKALSHLKGLSQLAAVRRDNPVQIKLWVNKKPMDIGPEIASAIQEDWRADYHDFGTIEGRLEAIQDHGALQIGVCDPLLKGSVRCYLPDDMLEEALGNFLNRVEITGDIHYRKNGVPISISVARIERLPDDSELPDADDVRGILRVKV